MFLLLTIPRCTVPSLHELRVRSNKLHKLHGLFSRERLTLQPISVPFPRTARCSIARLKHFTYQHFSANFSAHSSSSSSSSHHLPFSLSKQSGNCRLASRCPGESLNRDRHTYWTLRKIKHNCKTQASIELQLGDYRWETRPSGQGMWAEINPRSFNFCIFFILVLVVVILIWPEATADHRAWVARAAYMHTAVTYGGDTSLHLELWLPSNGVYHDHGKTLYCMNVAFNAER